MGQSDDLVSLLLEDIIDVMELTSLGHLAQLVVLVKKSARFSPVLMCISRVSPIATDHKLHGSKWNCTFSLRSTQV
jgi:hypothetical protein